MDKSFILNSLNAFKRLSPLEYVPPKSFDEMVVIKHADLRKQDNQGVKKVIFFSNQALKRPPDPPAVRGFKFKKSMIYLGRDLS